MHNIINKQAEIRLTFLPLVRSFEKVLHVGCLFSSACQIYNMVYISVASLGFPSFAGLYTVSDFRPTHSLLYRNQRYTPISLKFN